MMADIDIPDTAQAEWSTVFWLVVGITFIVVAWAIARMTK